ncbi:kinase [Thraustotheca clavata]|uniref:Kinase n=1 Tax=Thraustotheca clavata TaxID=74557 RepID=A0A1W0A812_9STRA|nr:kinase [Thraustotheca clavata]
MLELRIGVSLLVLVHAALNSTNSSQAEVAIITTPPSPQPLVTATTNSAPPNAGNNYTLIIVGSCLCGVVLVTALVLYRSRRRSNPKKRSIDKPELGGGKSPIAILADIDDDGFDVCFETMREREANESIFMTTQENVQHDLEALEPWRLDNLELLPQEPTENKNAFIAKYRQQFVFVKKWTNIKPYETTVFVGQLQLRLKLSCPQIVQLRGVSWLKTSEFQGVFEYMDGGTLRNYLQSTQVQESEWELKLLYILDIAYALEYLHGKGITHRDIRSSNVLLNRMGDAKLTNFGWLQPNIELAVSSTPWTAPEVTQSNLYSVAADIYSFGMLLYELDSHQFPGPSYEFRPNSPVAQHNSIPRKFMSYRSMNNFTSWQCISYKSGFGAFRIAESGDVACGSINGMNCSWSTDSCIKSPPKQLVCGAMLKSLYGVTGYENPRDWCATVRSQFQSANFTPATAAPSQLLINATITPTTAIPTQTIFPTTTDLSHTMPKSTLIFGLLLVASALVLLWFVLRQRRQRNQEDTDTFKTQHYIKSSPTTTVATPVVVLTCQGVVQESLDEEHSVLDTNLHDTNATMQLSIRESFQHDLRVLAPHQLQQYKLLVLSTEPSTLPKRNGVQIQNALYNGNRVVLHTISLLPTLDVQNQVGHLMLRIKLKSPHIVAMHGVIWTKPNEMQLVFEYMAQGQLKQYLSHSDDLTKLKYALSIVEGLLFVHNKGVSHRNISSSSVYLNSRGEAKLCDFGWLQNDTQVVVVNKHSAPELLKGKQCTVQTDIYALGVLLQEMDLPNSVKEDPHRKSTTIESLNGVIRACLDQDPRFRPSLLHIRRALQNELNILEP